MTANARKQLESGARDHAEVAGDDGGGVILEKEDHHWSWRQRPREGLEPWTNILRIERGDRRRPSFRSNSLAMRSSPREGFSRAVWRIENLEFRRELAVGQLGTFHACKTGSPGGANQ
jgi:hypothetical protein